MKKTSPPLDYSSIINDKHYKRSYRDSLYNYIITFLPSDHSYHIQKFCEAALLEAFRNGQNTKPKQ